MQAKSLSEKANRDRISATNLNPADYPLGSPESRATARAMLAQINRPTEAQRDESDCRWLYVGKSYLRDAEQVGPCRQRLLCPGSKDLENTQAYTRGESLSRARSVPVVPSHLDPVSRRSTMPSRAFEQIHGREPSAGDVFRFAHVKEWLSRHPRGYDIGIAFFIEAWKRQIPELPCPLKQENGLLFCRYDPASNNGVEWEEAKEQYPTVWWRYAEEEAFAHLGIKALCEIPHTEAVVFLGVVDGKHRCRLATEDEITADDKVVRPPEGSPWTWEYNPLLFVTTDQAVRQLPRRRES